MLGGRGSIVVRIVGFHGEKTSCNSLSDFFFHILNND